MSTLLHRIIATLILLPTVCMAQCPQSAIIYYVNGVNNPSYEKVERDTKLLQQRFIAHSTRTGANIDFEVLHNSSSGVFYDVLYEFASQKAAETITSSLDVYVGHGMAALGYLGFSDNVSRKDILTIIERLAINALPESARSELFNFESIIKSNALLRGRQAILVAHSQGNMFANGAYDLINSSLEKRYSRGMGVLNIASPALRTPSFQYLTIEEDLVIGVLRGAASPQAEPAKANFTAPRAWQHDLLGHNFANVYLSGVLQTRSYTNNLLVVEVIRKVELLLYGTSTFWDKPRYTYDENGNRIPRPPNIDDSSSVMVCFPGEVGGSS